MSTNRRNTPPSGGGNDRKTDGKTERKPGRPTGPRRPAMPQGRHLAMLGVAGESVGVLAGAAGWRFSGEPAWLVMSGVSLALALVLLRRI
jgi:hypothetical protein